MKKVLKTWLFHQCRMLSGSIQAGEKSAKLLIRSPARESLFQLDLSLPERVKAPHIGGRA